jgi:hypothetical protein
MIFLGMKPLLVSPLDRVVLVKEEIEAGDS